MRKFLNNLVELLLTLVLILEARRNEKLRNERDKKLSEAESDPSQAFKDKFNNGNDSGLWSGMSNSSSKDTSPSTTETN